MPLFRSIVLFIALLAQVFPAALMSHEAKPEACTMACCAWQEQAAAAELCGCISAPETPASAPLPANVPPASVRDVLPCPAWVAAEETFIPALHVAEISSRNWQPLTEASPTLPHVRLTVLFCSFLT